MEDFADISQVECVVEFGWDGKLLLFDLHVKLDCSSDNSITLLFDRIEEAIGNYKGL